MINERIKVSIIVPVYNVPTELLKKSVKSLKEQTLKEIEIILVDDGTPDTSGIICDELAKEDKRIIVVHQKNKGLCGARNTGLKMAKGQWVSFVDGDDWIEKDTYERMLKKVETTNAEIGAFGYVKDYPNYSVSSNLSKYFDETKIYEGKEDLNYLLCMVLNYNSNFSSVTTKIIKRDFLTKNNIYHEEELKQGAEGIEFNIRLFKNAKKVVFVNQDFYHYIYNSSSITNVHDEKNHELVLNCFNKIKEEINSLDIEIKDWFYNRLKYVILTIAISGYFSPTNKEKYSIQKNKFNVIINNDLIREALINKNTIGLSLARKITLFLIKHKMYIFVKIIAYIRYKQKNGKVS